MNSKAPWFALILLPLLVTGVAAAVSIFAGAPQPVTEKDLAWHPMSTELYTENWSFLSAFDDGSFSFSSLVISNAGLGDSKPSVDVSYWAPNGKVTADLLMKKKKDLVASTENMQISVGKSSAARKGDRVMLFADGGKVRTDLAFKMEAGPWQFADGRITMNKPEDFWKYVIITPRAQVSGTITTPEGSRTVHGKGYIDHTWSNLAFFSFSKKWKSLRIHGPELSLNFVEFEGNGDLAGKNVRLLLAADDKGVVYSTTSDIDVKVLDASKGFKGYLYPTRMTIKTRRVVIEVSVEQIMQSIDVLEHMSAVEAAVIRKFVSDPALVRVKAKAKVTMEGYEPFTTVCAMEMLML